MAKAKPTPEHPLTVTKRRAGYGLVVIACFFVLGLIIIKGTHATSFVVSAEAEHGTKAGKATAITDSKASGGAAIEFATPQACGSGGACTAAEVATHNSKTNCWVIYSNKVYNITAWVPQHPGGESVYNSTTCGHDITQYLNGSASVNGDKHKHGSEAYADLETYYLAPLQ